MALTSSRLHRLTSPEDILWPINRWEIMDRVRVLTPLRNITAMSQLIFVLFAFWNDLSPILAFPVPGHFHRNFTDAFQGKIARIGAVTMVCFLFYSLISYPKSGSVLPA
jgi:hypothetical protein